MAGLNGALALCLFTALAAQVAAAQTPQSGSAPPAPAPASPQLLRYDDDHAALGRGCADGDRWACLKEIPFGEHVRASFGGELGLRAEYQRNSRFGAAFSGDDLVALQRVLAFGDVEIGEHLRVFAQLNGAFAQGRRIGDLPTDENRAEWQNAFLELRGPIGESRVGLRLGQQELRFGNARLIDAREGLNVRRSFAGARAYWAQGPWRVDALDVRPRIDRPGAFDDARSDTQRLRGLYATRASAGAGFDLYALETEDRAARTAEGLLEETRRSYGGRHFGSHGPWEWNAEALIQRGSAGANRIDAAAAMIEGDYGRPHWPMTLRLGALLNYASGDDRPGDGELGTFNALYARGNLLDEDGTLGLRNLRSAQLTAEFVPAPGWFVQASAGRFWRDSLADGVYRPSGQPLATAGGSRARAVTTTVSGIADWQIDPRWNLTFKVAVLEPEAFLEQRGFDERFVFSETILRFRF